ncbi:hypothetical protein AKJ09_09042 [Labilithrix luteola]|uniref:DNA topoisomerase (ATP-hydrolyzing) n=1 Tax=Labilithrix luteola TaxID=1391654 RepID=A0A0K1Q9G8_9BACT|nr:hypothetical protein AKJ09_09042 [Labilithrix luteola]
MLRLASTELEARWSDDEMCVMFHADPARFPEPLAAHALIGVAADLTTAYPGLCAFVRDLTLGLDTNLVYRRGVLDRLLEVATRSKLNHPPLRFQSTTGEVRFDLAFAWRPGPGLQLVALVNGKRTPNGGTHVRGFWEGIAAAIEKRLPTRDARRRLLTEREVPRNAVLVISVHLDDPRYGPATRDCLHDVRALEIIRSDVEEAFGAWLEREWPGVSPPWQLLGGFHDSEPWQRTYAEMLSKPAETPFPDPYLHRDDE